MTFTMAGGEPFFFPGSRTGCLLVHGFTGAPNEMRLLGEHLAACGFSVLGIRLSGHGTEMPDLLRAREQDWIASVEDGYHLLRGCTDRIFVMGLSMGGLLALHAGAHLPVAGVVAMSTPYRTPHPLVQRMRPAIPLLSHFWRYAKKSGSDLVDEAARETHVDYEAHPLRAVAELEDLVQEMQASLPDVQVPVLLIQSRGDTTVPSDHVELIADALGSEDIKTVWLQSSGHVITRDVEQDMVFQACESFIKRVLEKES